MATFFSLNDKVEAALAAIAGPATDELGPVQVLTGKSAEDMSLPCVICSAETEGDEDPRGSGNYFVRGVVEVRHVAVADESGAGNEDEAAVKAADQGLVSAVFGAVRVTDLAEQLTAAVDDLTVFSASVQFGAPESGYGEKGQWIDRLPFRCYACGSSLAP